jgi:hypothetical protein
LAARCAEILTSDAGVLLRMTEKNGTHRMTDERYRLKGRDDRVKRKVRHDGSGKRPV